MKRRWKPSDKFLASSAHIGWALAAITNAVSHQAVGAWGPWQTFGICVGLFTVYALVKEYLFDIFIVESDSIVGSTLDFVTYELGALVLSAVATISYTAINFWCSLVLSAFLLLLLTVLDYQNFFRLLVTLPRER